MKNHNKCMPGPKCCGETLGKAAALECILEMAGLFFDKCHGTCGRDKTLQVSTAQEATAIEKANHISQA